MDVVFSSWPEFLAACFVLALAEGVYVLFGFGAGLIAIGLLALILPYLSDVVVLLLLVNLPIECWVVWKNRNHIQWTRTLFVGVGLLLGVPLGTWILHFGRPDFLLVLLGLVLMIAGIGFCMLPQKRVVTWSWWSTWPIGAFAGVLGGLFGTAGPPLIAYFRLEGADKRIFRANLMAIFFLVTLVRLPCYGFSGLLTPERWWSAMALFPSVGLGAFVGNGLHEKMKERDFQKAVAWALAAIGSLLVLSAF